MAGKLFVASGTGFVGTALVRSLSQDSDVNFIYSYRTSPQSFARKQALRLELTDSGDYRRYANELADVTCLIYCAATVGYTADSDWIDDFDQAVLQNLTIVRNLLAMLPSIKKVIYVSSCSAAIVGHDPSCYGLGKLMVEQSLTQLCRLRALQLIILRFPQLYGPDEPHQTFVSRFINALVNGRPVTLVNHGAVIRDILYVEDAIACIRYSIDANKQGIFTITDQQSYTVYEILHLLIEIIAPPQVSIDNVNQPALKGIQKSFHFDNTAGLLGYRLHYDLHAGLQATTEHWRG